MSDQTKLESGIEVAANIGSGMILAWALWYWPLPQYFGVSASASTSLSIVILFTVVSVGRSYFWRRFFARRFHKVVHRWVSRCWELTGW